IAGWRRERVQTTLPPERVFGAVRTGARYVRHSTELHAVLFRSALFVLPASAVWALLPLVAHQSLGLTAAGYGLVLGGLGVGAITGALVLPWLRAHVAMETMLVVATALFASTSLGLALVSSIVPALALTFGGGIGWMVVMSTFSIAAQESVPAWV